MENVKDKLFIISRFVETLNKPRFAFKSTARIRERESEERETREMAQFQQDETYLSVILVYMFSISTKTKETSPVSDS